jgi:hypothetical protein
VHTPLEHAEDTQNPIPITAQITATQGSLVVDSLRVNMRFRFIARDLGGSSLVEAAVDDFMIEVLPPMPAGIEPGASPARRSAAMRRGAKRPPGSTTTGSRAPRTAPRGRWCS